MATKGTKKSLPHDLEEVAKSDWEALQEWVTANPALSAAIAGFVLLCVLAGLGYRANAGVRDQRAATEYARALMNEDPALRATQLAPLTESSSHWTAEALYMMGEAAYQAQDYAKAKSAFEALRERYADAPSVPDAVEGLGYIAEDQGDHKGALAAYQEIKTKWPGVFASQRQDLNIGRCQEHLGDLAAAAKAYQTQVDVFPDSAVAGKAQQSLDRLKLTHPELFPVEQPEEPVAAPAADTAPPGPSDATSLNATPGGTETGPVPDVNTGGTPSQVPATGEAATPQAVPQGSAPPGSSSAVKGSGAKSDGSAPEATVSPGAAQ